MPDWAIITMLIAAGLVLLALEVYVPGFVLGSIAIATLVIAAVLSYGAYGGSGVLFVVVLEAGLSGIVVFTALRYLPATRLGKRMTLGATQSGQRAQRAKETALVGQHGVAQTPLRPAGMALIDGKRLDVVAESGMIESGTTVRVVAVRENRIIVRPA